MPMYTDETSLMSALRQMQDRNPDAGLDPLEPRELSTRNEYQAQREKMLKEGMELMGSIPPGRLGLAAAKGAPLAMGILSAPHMKELQQVLKEGLGKRPHQELLDIIHSAKKLPTGFNRLVKEITPLEEALKRYYGRVLPEDIKEAHATTRGVAELGAKTVGLSPEKAAPGTLHHEVGGHLFLKWLRERLVAGKEMPKGLEDFTEKYNEFSRWFRRNPEEVSKLSEITMSNLRQGPEEPFSQAMSELIEKGKSSPQFQAFPEALRSLVRRSRVASRWFED